MRRLRLVLALLLCWLLPSSAFAAGTIVYQGGTGTQIWPYTVTFNGLFSPSLIGGTGTTSTLTLQSTSGVGADGADIIFKVGNNGATEAGRILNNGNVVLGSSGKTFLGKKTLTADNQADVILFSDENGTHAQSGDYYNKLIIYGGNETTRHLSMSQTSTDALVENIIAGNLQINSVNNVILQATGGNVSIGNNSTPASLLDLRAGDLTFSGANGQKYVQGRATELVAVGSGISTKATTIQIPADAIVYAVPVRVKTQPGGTTTMTVTATTSGTAFQKGASISTAATTTDPGTKNTPVNYNSVAAQTVTLTFDAPTTDALGEVRIDIYYATSTPPTS